MQKSAGLILFTEIPTMGGLVAVLQVRGTYNHEKIGPESFPGGCQVTIHGKSDTGKSHYDILSRELLEEFGDIATPMIMAKWHEAVELSRVEGKEDVITWGLKVTADFLKHVQLNASTGGLRFITKEKVPTIRNLRDFSKDEGVLSRDIIAMFPDDTQAVRLGFLMFGTPVTDQSQLWE